MASRTFSTYNVIVNGAEKTVRLTPKKGANRSYLLIDNRSAGDVYVDFEKPPQGTVDGIRVPAGGVWELDNVAPDGNVFIGGSLGTTDQRVNIAEAF